MKNYWSIHVRSTFRNQNKRNMKQISCLLAYFLLSSGVVFAAHPHGHEGGQGTYEEHCAHCHGYEGDGQGYAFENVYPKPRDFTSAMFKIRTTATGEEPTLDDLYSIITRGMPGTTMPSWQKTLSEQHRREVAAYVEKFYREEEGDEEEEDEEDEEDSGDEEADEEEEEDEEEDEDEAPAGPLVIPSPVPSSAESIARGKELTLKVECDKCHGKAGRGDGPSAMELKEDWTQGPIRPADWTAPWRFRGGNRPEDIFRTVRTGLNGTPMPTFAEDLTVEETWDVVNYVRSLAPEKEPEVKRTLVSKKVEEQISLESGSPIWEGALEYYVPLAGQVILEDRLYQPIVHSLRFRSVYNEDEIAFRIQWNDPTSRDHKDFAGGDELILQFPAKIKEGDTSSPYFLMGRPGKSVNLWIWGDDYRQVVDAKSSRLGDWTVRQDRAISSAIQYQDGRYTLIMKRSRVNGQKGSIQFPPERTVVQIAFSAVDGSNQEGGSKRGVTTWYNLLLEQPVGTKVYYVPVILFLLILGFEIWLMKRTRQQKQEQ